MSISVSEQELRALALKSMLKNQNKEKPKQTAEIVTIQITPSPPNEIQESSSNLEKEEGELSDGELSKSRNQAPQSDVNTSSELPPRTSTPPADKPRKSNDFDSILKDYKSQKERKASQPKKPKKRQEKPSDDWRNDRNYVPYQPLPMPTPTPDIQMVDLNTILQTGIVPAGLITNLITSGVIDPTQPIDINTLALLTTMATQNPEFNTANYMPYPSINENNNSPPMINSSYSTYAPYGYNYPEEQYYNEVAVNNFLAMPTNFPQKDDMDMDIEPSQVNAPIALSARMEQQIKDDDLKKKKSPAAKKVVSQQKVSPKTLGKKHRGAVPMKEVKPAKPTTPPAQQQPSPLVIHVDQLDSDEEEEEETPKENNKSQKSITKDKQSDLERLKMLLAKKEEQKRLRESQKLQQSGSNDSNDKTPTAIDSPTTPPPSSTIVTPPPTTVVVPKPTTTTSATAVVSAPTPAPKPTATPTATAVTAPTPAPKPTTTTPTVAAVAPKLPTEQPPTTSTVHAPPAAVATTSVVSASPTTIAKSPTASVVPTPFAPSLHHSIDETFINNYRESIKNSEKQMSEQYKELLDVDTKIVTLQQDILDNQNQQSNLEIRVKILREQLRVMEASLQDVKKNEYVLKTKLSALEDIQSQRRQQFHSSKLVLERDRLKFSELEIEFKVSQEVVTTNHSTPPKDSEPKNAPPPPKAISKQPSAETTPKELPKPPEKPKETPPTKPTEKPKTISSEKQKQTPPKPIEKPKSTAPPTEKPIEKPKPVETIVLPTETITESESSKPIETIHYKEPLDMSPLFLFRSFRLNPIFKTQYDMDVTCPTFSHKIDPENILCRYELHGVCNDEECKWLHKRDYLLSDQELMDDLMSYVKFPAGQREVFQKYAEKLVKLDALPLQERAGKVIGKLSGYFEAPHYISECKRKRLRQSHQNMSKILRKSNETSKKSGTRPSDKSKQNINSNLSTSQGEEEEEVSDSIILPQFIPLYQSVEEEDLDLEEHRYWKFAEPKEYESYLSDHPNDIHSWIEAAFLHIRNIPKMSPELKDKALSVLARGLERNQNSVFLWRVYLSLYMSRYGAMVTETRQLFDEAVTFNPSSYQIWRLYIDHENSPKHKISLYEKALFSLSSHPVQAFTGPEEASKVLKDLVLEHVQVYCDVGNREASIRTLSQYLYPQLRNQDTAIKLEAILLETDLCELYLSHIHLLLFNHLPNSSTTCPKTKRQPFTVFRWELLDPQKLPVSIELLRKAMEEAIAFFKSIKQEILPLCYNYVFLEIAMKNIEEARCLCQQFLRSNPALYELWELYTFVERRAGNQTDALLIYERSIQRYPLSTRLCNGFALLLHEIGKSQQAAHLLAQSVLQFLTTHTPQTQALMQYQQDKQQQQQESLSKEIQSQVKNIFHNLLKLPSNPISLTLDSSKVANDFYLWENYLLFIQLTMNIEELKEAYEYAIERITGIYERQHLWIKYMAFARHLKTEAEMSEIVQRIFSEQHFDIVSEDLKDSRLYSLLYPDSSSSSPKDYTFVNKICDDFLFPLPDIRKTYYYERILDIYPDNVQMTLRAAQHAIKIEDSFRARSILVSSIRVNSKIPDTWLCLAQIEIAEGRIEEARAIYKAAINDCSNSKDIWRKYLEFETSIDKSKSKEIIEAAAKVGVAL